MWPRNRITLPTEEAKAFSIVWNVPGAAPIRKVFGKLHLTAHLPSESVLFTSSAPPRERSLRYTFICGARGRRLDTGLDVFPHRIHSIAADELPPRWVISHWVFLPRFEDARFPSKKSILESLAPMLLAGRQQFAPEFPAQNTTPGT